MNIEETTTLPPLAVMGGTKVMTLTPVVGTPKREYAEIFVPGQEELEDGELRVTILGSGNPWPTRAQASAGILVDQLPPIPGHQCVSFTPTRVPPPESWAEALIPVD